MQQTLTGALGGAFVERESEIRACLLGLIAREHVLLVGPPGTAKSMLARAVASAVGGRTFNCLLTKFSVPEEVFGPVSLAGLRKDRYERKLDGYAADADVVFLDEVFKASSAILNTLLGLLEERAIENGGRRVECPLRLAIGASNEWPEGQELGALLDRWTIRRTVRPISSQGRDRLLYADLPPVQQVASLQDLDAAHSAAMGLPVSQEARDALGTILDELAGAGIRPGDRRCRKAVRVARAAAHLDGASQVEPRHLEDLGMVLWSDPSQADRAGEIVERVANPTGARLTELLRECEDVGRPTAADERMAAIRKLEEIEREAAGLEVAGNGRTATVRAYVRRERVRLQAAALGIDPAKAEELLGGGA